MKSLILSCLAVVALSAPPKKKCNTDTQEYSGKYDVTGWSFYSCKGILLTATRGIYKYAYSYDYSYNGTTFQSCNDYKSSFSGVELEDESGNKVEMQQRSAGSGDYNYSWNYPTTEGSSNYEFKLFLNMNGAFLHEKFKMIKECSYSWSYNYDTNTYKWSHECPIDKWYMKCDA
jgi:hypothetical protein